MIDRQPLKLNHSDLIEVVKKTPLVAIDLIIENARNQVLLGLRKNAPAKDFWFVPGGRILKNESIQAAFKRIVKDELQINLTYDKATFRGVFEHWYPDNFTQKQKGSTHYIVLAHKWFDQKSLLKNKKVHPYTKAYFE
ncbi:MAG: GDP-mannose mannosyl hydrolase [Planctomycetota bacterium]|jgi:colanic acid biosynthesis protein WcaH